MADCRSDPASIMNPRLLYVITDLELGGVPLHLFRLASHMVACGFDVTVSSLRPAGPVGDMLARSAISVRSCEGCCGLDYRVMGRLGEIIDEVNPDLVHSLLFHANQATRIAAALAGLGPSRVIAEIQTVEVERPWHLVVDRWTHRLSCLTVCNSPSVVEHLYQAAGIQQHRLRLIRGGIDLENFDRAGHSGPSVALCDGALHTSVPADRILWVGRLDPVKGLHVLLQAMPRVITQRRAQLFLVGDGPHRHVLETLRDRLHLRDVVHFLGARTDVPSLLKCADVFVFPSRTEGLPNALLEAMAAARPIIATDVPGNRDLIVHGQSGWLVPYGDTNALAEGIVSLLSNRELAATLGRRAREIAADQWSLRRTFAEYVCLYDEVLATQSEGVSKWGKRIAQILPP